MTIVAVLSGIHGPDESIARQVADRLGYRLVGPELLEDAARLFDTTVDRLARAMAGSRSMLDGLTHEREKSLVYIRHALARMISSDDLVYHGPATLLIPRRIGHVLRVGIVADFDYRLDRATQLHGLSAKEAAVQINRSDLARARWTERLFSCGPWHRSLYDLKIPLPAQTVEEAVDLICSAVRQDALRPSNRSIEAVLDFLLATRVHLALLDEGYHHCAVTAREGEVTVVVNRKPGAPGAFGAIHALRYEQIEREVTQIAQRVEGVESTKIHPGSGFKESSRALLVDSERDDVLTLSERLEMHDIASDVVHDGEEALSVVDAMEPEVIVLDLQMPGTDPIEVLRRLKRNHRRTEVIVVAGPGHEEQEQAARDLGAFTCLRKPVEIEVLAETMRRAARRARGEGGEGPTGRAHVRLRDVLQPDRVTILEDPVGTKRALIERLVHLAKQRLPGIDEELVLGLLLEREGQVTTGIGHDIALPHATVPGLERPCCFVVQVPGGVDYEALDGNPVHLVFMLLSPPQRSSLHIRFLARLARLLDDVSFVSRLVQAEGSDELYRLIIEEDGRHV